MSVRERVLNKIRMALATPTPLPFPAAEALTNPIPLPPDDLVLQFAERFTALQGKFAFCTNTAETQQSFAALCRSQGWAKIYCEEAAWRGLVPAGLLHTNIATCDASITGCEALVSRTGSIVLSAEGQGRLPSVYAPVHVCMAYASQVVYDVADGLQAVKTKYGNALPSLITFATGPSRTADIEKTLVVGVHGPKEVYCFVVGPLSL